MECPKCNHVFTIPRKKKTPKETDPRVNELLKHYVNEFKRNYNDEEPFMSWGAYGTIAKKLLRVKDIAELKQIISEYVVCGDNWFKSGGYRFSRIEEYIQKRVVSKKTPLNNAYDALIPEWKRGPV